MRSQSITLSIAALACALSLGTSNPKLTALACASLAAIVLITWRPGESPGLAFTCIMQWVAAALAIFHADLLGVELWTMSETRHIEEAGALSLLAVTGFAVGGRIGMGWGAVLLRSGPVVVRGLERRLLTFWAGGNVMYVALAYLDRGGLSQPVRLTRDLKWVPVFVLFAVVMQRGRGWSMLLGVLMTEISMGFLSFFAGFKVPLYVLAIAFVATQRRRAPSFARSIGVLLTVCMAIYLGIAWSAVKMDYRDYVSGYSGQQVISVSGEDQAKKFMQLIGSLDAERMSEGAEHLADRIAYIDYFGAAMDYVPEVLPYEHGRRMLGALVHVLEPRILFPDKPVLDDTADTERYTGQALRSGRQTSICLGYPAEAYIDVGPWIMLFPVMAFGWLHGRFAGIYLRSRHDPLLGAAFSATYLLNVSTIENGFAKMLGGSLLSAGMYYLVWGLAGPRITAWLWQREEGLSLAPPPPDSEAAR